MNIWQQPLRIEPLVGTCRECGATNLKLGGDPLNGYRVAAHHPPIKDKSEISSMPLPTPNCAGSDMPPAKE